MIRRKLQTIIEQALKASTSNNVLLVQGARQVGKTSLVESILKEMSDVCQTNLEEDVTLKIAIDQCVDFSEFETILKAEKGFDKGKTRLLYIDEAQESDKLGSFVRFMKEQWDHCKVIISGSSMSRLFRNEQRIPVGRFLTYLVTPFSFAEFLMAGNQSVLLEIISQFSPDRPISNLMHDRMLQSMDQYLEVGGLPEVVSTYFNGGDWKRVRRTILASQADDFLRKSGFGSATLFMDGLRAVANNLGFPAKNTQVRGENSKQVQKLLELQRAWFLVFEIDQKGISSTSAMLPKRYIYDLGIAQEVRNMPFPSLSIIKTTNAALRSQLGGVFENFLLNELIAAEAGLFDLSGWKRNSTDGVEVDFVWRSDAIVPIEVKATRSISLRHFSSLLDYLNFAKLTTGILVSNAPFQKFVRGDRRLFNVPLYLAQPEIIRRL